MSNQKFTFAPQEDITTIELAHCTHILIWTLAQSMQNYVKKDWSIEKIHPGITAMTAEGFMDKYNVKRHFEFRD